MSKHACLGAKTLLAIAISAVAMEDEPSNTSRPRATSWELGTSLGRKSL